MAQLRELFNRLSWRQRIWLAVAVLAMAGGLAALLHWNAERDFKPLFSGLAPEDAGTLTAKLRESGVEYRLGDGGSTILVPSAQVAEVRLNLASAGLPKSGRLGFELFDKANFGASEFAEQVNYHRAIEGELERSVMSLKEVEQARVHVTMAKESVYSEARQSAKASVLVKLRHAGGLTAENVAAICQLTASAVPGLAVQEISVLDTNGNLLSRPRAGAETPEGDGNTAGLEFRKDVEKDVQLKVASTLEPLLGAGHFRVGVSADVDLTSSDESEEVYDPQKSVVLTSQKTEDGPAVQEASGVPGTASNLPRPAPRPASGAGNYSRRTENLTYQPSRTVKHTRLPRGALKRLSVSVLVDHTLRWEGAKRAVEAPSGEKLKVIRDLTSAAIGLDPKRGDQLVVEAFPFESTLNAEPLEPGSPAAPPGVRSRQLPPWLENLLAQNNAKLIVGIGAGAAVVLLGGLFVFLRRSKKNRKAEMTAQLEAAQRKGPAGSSDEVQRQIEARLAEQTVEQAKREAEALLSLKFPTPTTKKTEVLTKHIAEGTKKDPTAMALVVRSWLHGEKHS